MEGHHIGESITIYFFTIQALLYSEICNPYFYCSFFKACLLVPKAKSASSNICLQEKDGLPFYSLSIANNFKEN